MVLAEFSERPTFLFNTRDVKTLLLKKSIFVGEQTMLLVYCYRANEYFGDVRRFCKAEGGTGIPLY